MFYSCLVPVLMSAYMYTFILFFFVLMLILKLDTRLLRQHKNIQGNEMKYFDRFYYNYYFVLILLLFVLYSQQRQRVRHRNATLS